MKHITSADIIKALGMEVILHALGLRKRMLFYMQQKGKFPSGWYREIKRLCDENGVFCPMEAFDWKEPQKTEREEESSP